MDNSENVFTAPWYPWYVNDALTSERIEIMSLTEEGAYRRALDRAWKKGSIPADPVLCAKAIGKRCPVKVAEVVLKMFRPLANDPTRMVNDTLEKVREEQRQKYAKRSAKGKDAAEKRWHGDATSIPQAMPKQCHSESDTDSLKRTTTTTTPRQTDDEWLDSLKESPAYAGIAILTEFEKAKIWTAANNRQCTRRFFVNWLNKCRPMDVKTNGTNRPATNSKQSSIDKLREYGEVFDSYPSESEITGIQ